MHLQIVTRSPGFATGAYGPVALCRWDVPALEDHVRAASEVLSQVAKREGRIYLMAFFGPNVQPPDGANRKMMTAHVARLGNRVGAFANVLEVEGFRGAAIRAVLTGMVLAVRPDFPTKMCATMQEASEFLASHSEGKLTRAQLLIAAEGMRSASAGR